MSDCCKRKTARKTEEKRALENRLKRIEGQVRGVIGMLEEDAYCVDVLVQVSAISSALSSFSRELLARHIKGCVTEDIRSGREDSAEELALLVSRYIK